MFSKLAWEGWFTTSSINLGAVNIWCDDLRPSMILVDERLQIEGAVSLKEAIFFHSRLLPLVVTSRAHFQLLERRMIQIYLMNPFPTEESHRVSPENMREFSFFLDQGNSEWISFQSQGWDLHHFLGLLGFVETCKVISRTFAMASVFYLNLHWFGPDPI